MRNVNPEDKPTAVARVMQFLERLKTLDPDIIARALPFGAYVAMMSLTDLVDNLTAHSMDLRWWYLLKVGAVAGLLVAFRRRYTELEGLRHARVNHLLLSVAAGVAVFVAWVGLDAGWMTLGKGAGFDPRAGAGIDWLLVLVRCSGAVLVVPLMEELFWRSLLLRWLDHDDFLHTEPDQASVQAFWIVALLFGFEHNLWLAGMVAALVYNMLYMVTKNLWMPIISHAVTNAALAVWVVWTGHWEYW